jgi:hypothetical protein
MRPRPCPCELGVGNDEGEDVPGVGLDVPRPGLHLGLAVFVVAAHLGDAVLDVAPGLGEGLGEVDGGPSTAPPARGKRRSAFSARAMDPQADCMAAGSGRSHGGTAGHIDRGLDFGDGAGLLDGGACRRGPGRRRRASGRGSSQVDLLVAVLGPSGQGEVVGFVVGVAGPEPVACTRRRSRWRPVLGAADLAGEELDADDVDQVGRLLLLDDQQEFGVWSPSSRARAPVSYQSACWL